MVLQSAGVRRAAQVTVVTLLNRRAACLRGSQEALRQRRASQLAAVEPGQVALLRRIDDAVRSGNEDRIRFWVNDLDNHLHSIGQALGFSYEEGAVIPDGTPRGGHLTRVYTPSDRPGGRFPHIWRDMARKHSTLDWFDKEFTVVAGPAVAPLFRDLPGLEQEIPFAPEPSTWEWFGLWKLVRRRRWGLVLDLQGSRLARFLSARRRAVRRPSNPASEPVHKVIEAARVLKLEDEPAPPFLFVGPERQAQAEALLKPTADAAGPILALAPAADWPERLHEILAEVKEAEREVMRVPVKRLLTHRRHEPVPARQRAAGG